MKKYCLELSFTQSTDGEVDNRTLMSEYSDDGVIHALKTQVFTEELTKSVNNITKKFTDMAISVGGEVVVESPKEEKEDKKEFVR